MNSKLVRDNIPSIISQSGKEPVITLASRAQKIKLLKDKLIEESLEAKSTSSTVLLIEELADLLQVIHSLSAELNISLSQINKQMIKKAQLRGEFKKGYILNDVK